MEKINEKKLYQREYYIFHKDLKKEINRIYYENNKNFKKEINKLYYENNKDLLKEKNKKYKDSHIKERKAIKENYFINFDLIIVEKRLITISFD